MNNPLENANKGTSVQAALDLATKATEAKKKLPYATGNVKEIQKALLSFSKNVLRNKQLNKFTKLVTKYVKTTKTNIPSDLNEFVTYYVKNKPKTVNLYIDNKVVKNLKVKYTTTEAKKLYIMFWTSLMITEHNKRVNEVELLSKQYNEEYYGHKIDIRKPVIRDGKVVTTSINLSDLEDDIKHEGRLKLRSDKAAYKLPTHTNDDIRVDITSKQKHNLERYGNLKLLFLNNLMVALDKAHWDDAFDLAKQLIDKGHLADVYNAYISSNISIVFEYSETVGDGGSDQQIFIDKLQKFIDKHKK